ncbi:hypothetical protein AMTR_s00052p00158710 [Amborella trichopoda]|uniref:Uncharacterized protein n=1 Tax=Amborella trichopoda TaxID=13333 RepID=U5D1W8_AMBTC|nr:hypothetical protein AMTR_s00052p00158710 [Amborella trichopoda]
MDNAPPPGQCTTTGTQRRWAMGAAHSGRQTDTLYRTCVYCRHLLVPFVCASRAADAATFCPSASFSLSYQIESLAFASCSVV